MISIIILLSIIALTDLNKVGSRGVKKAPECFPKKRMFSQTFAHGHSMNDRRQRNMEGRQAEKSENGKKRNRPEMNKSQGIAIARAYRPPGSLLDEAADD